MDLFLKEKLSVPDVPVKMDPKKVANRGGSLIINNFQTCALPEVPVKMHSKKVANRGLGSLNFFKKISNLSTYNFFSK